VIGFFGLLLSGVRKCAVNTTYYTTIGVIVWWFELCALELTLMIESHFMQSQTQYTTFFSTQNVVSFWDCGIGSSGGGGIGRFYLQQISCNTQQSCSSFVYMYDVLIQ
jgi:hypothetical protein